MTDLMLRRSGHPTGDLTLHVAGEIDGATAPSLERALLDALATAPRHLLIDGTDITFCDSRGLATLITAWRTAGQTGVTMSIRPSPRLRRVMALSGIDSLFDLVP
ncbi:STAS domain-containing protein [Catenuloplanes atrovinosus]|uniref:Anti-sigma factor antagonist n=1 Tax=Catenuloplanes atrovinosus TaxID=137266 RepID=A0AAE4CAV3_9ACTN|nr:STAS domain-containing protein [Catenuloplanes atrovinosus]MDR7274965.1 anti-sigma B factor antagonist [Catenuloplanes atrovinosus]